LYAVVDEESVGCPDLSPLAPAVPLRVLNPGKDRYFIFLCGHAFSDAGMYARNLAGAFGIASRVRPVFRVGTGNCRSQ
jgi:hypothetical protein